MIFFDDSFSTEEFDMGEDEDIAMILLLHKNKRPKHGGSVIGRERIPRLQIDADHKLMLNYFVVGEVYPEQFFDAGLG
jgi:hypothetical protein